MGKLYDEAAHEDKKIADRWQKRTKEDLSHQLTVSDIEYIIDPVFHGRIKLELAVLLLQRKARSLREC
jgi:hypothetical protein